MRNLFLDFIIIINIKNSTFQIYFLSNQSNSLFYLNISSDVKEIANDLQQKEALITEDVLEQLQQCLETLKKRIEHEGPAGKRFYIYKTLVTHLLPVTNVAFDRAGNR